MHVHVLVLVLVRTERRGDVGEVGDFTISPDSFVRILMAAAAMDFDSFVKTACLPPPADKSITSAVLRI